MQSHSKKNNYPDDIISLRHRIHQDPSLSGQEEKTVNHLIDWFSSFNATLSPICERRGLLVTFDHGIPGKSIVLRAETDALPIMSTSKKAWASKTSGVSHACGHDGHAATLASLASFLETTEFPGKVTLLFQPDEERGLGAAKVLNEKAFNLLKPDLIFGFHNLPGYPLGTFVIKEKVFTAASCGVKINLSGETAHASTPYTGISPTVAVMELIKSIPEMSQTENQDDFRLITLTHAKIGDETWGIAPGEATLCFTVRTFSTQELAVLIEEIKDKSKTIASKHHLGINISEHEYFKATYNHIKPYSQLIHCLKSNGFDYMIKKEPFPWSEDFGNYTELIEGSFFGIGAGLDHPALHAPDYDYPDETIESMYQFFQALLKQYWS